LIYTAKKDRNSISKKTRHFKNMRINKRRSMEFMMKPIN